MTPASEQADHSPLARPSPVPQTFASPYAWLQRALNGEEDYTYDYEVDAALWWPQEHTPPQVWWQWDNYELGYDAADADYEYSYAYNDAPEYDNESITRSSVDANWLRQFYRFRGEEDYTYDYDYTYYPYYIYEILPSPSTPSLADELVELEPEPDPDDYIYYRYWRYEILPIASTTSLADELVELERNHEMLGQMHEVHLTMTNAAMRGRVMESALVYLQPAHCFCPVATLVLLGVLVYVALRRSASAK